jgi:uncharacterized protein (DUF362 family)
MLTWHKLALLFLIGAIAASVGDAFHVRTQTTFYAPECFIWYIKGIPFWIPLLFGVASAFFGIAYELGKTILGRTHFREVASIRHVLIAGLVYMSCHCLSGYIFPRGIPLTHILLGVPVILSWAFLDRTWGGALVCFFVGVVGVGAESLLVHKGIFSFSDQANQLCGVATWLPWIYMAGGLAVGRFVELKRGCPVSLERREHPIYSKESTVYIIQKKNKRRCLEKAVTESHFIAHLNAHWKESGEPKEAFRIAIKPNFMCASFETDISVYTDVELVECLVEMIRKEGYEDISVVESQMVWSLFRDGRAVAAVAAMLGYSQNGYRIVDLTPNPVDVNYDDELLGPDYAGPAWMDANYRISFAKNKTHFQCYYTGCMKNIYGCLPVQDKLCRYHKGLRGRDQEFHTATIAILEKFPVDFAFLDAYFSGDGFAGLIRDGSPNVTNTIICGENCFAVDWVQGEKMGLDPRRNYVVQRAVERWGEPQITTEGPTEEWEPWQNVPRGVGAVANILEEWYHFARFVCYIFAYRMDPRFPLHRSWMCILSAPFRKFVEWLDEHSGLVYPTLVIVDLAAITVALIMIIRCL